MSCELDIRDNAHNLIGQGEKTPDLSLLRFWLFPCLGRASERGKKSIACRQCTIQGILLAAYPLLLRGQRLAVTTDNGDARAGSTIALAAGVGIPNQITRPAITHQHGAQVQAVRV